MSVKKLMSLKGRVALITGGSRGLGLQIAEALAEMGANLALTARKADELAEAKAHLASSGVEVLTVVNDLAKSRDRSRDGGRGDAKVSDASIFWSTTPATPGARPPRTTRWKRGAK